MSSEKSLNRQMMLEMEWACFQSASVAGVKSAPYLYGGRTQNCNSF